MKTRNLTQSRVRIDPIDPRIKGFSFCLFKDKIRHSRDNSTFSILLMKYGFQTLPRHENGSRRERNQEIQGLSCLNSLIYSKDRRMLYIIKENVYLLAKLGVASGFGSLITCYLYMKLHDY